MDRQAIGSHRRVWALTLFGEHALASCKHALGLALIAMLGTAASSSAAPMGASLVTPGPLYKIVTYQVPESAWNEFLARCRVNAAAARRQPGIIGFTLLADQKSEIVVGIEEYTDIAASDAHQKTKAFSDFIATEKRLGVSAKHVFAHPFDPAPQPGRAG